jgi:hypothetical protein
VDDVIRLPGIGPVIGGQVRYQLTLMLRTPRTLMAGLILVLVGVAMAGLHLTAGAIGGLLLAAWALGGLLVSVRFFQWDPHRPRHARAAGAANHDRSG